MSRAESDRRTFLTRLGLFGVLAGAAVVVPTVANANLLPSPVLDLLRQVLNTTSRETYNALTVFVVPGPDAFSQRQGAPRTEPGALEARAPDFMLDALDQYMPMPDQLFKPLSSALAGGLRGVPLNLTGGLLGLDLSTVNSLGDAVDGLLANDEVLPLSSVVALMVNFVAVQVNPKSAIGVGQSPFARLSREDKAKVFSLIEADYAALAGTLDSQVSAPLRGSVSGIISFIGGALLSYSAYASYCEWSTFSASSRTVTSEPVGWQISRYNLGTRDGWAEMRGYYQNRKAVSA